MKNLFSDTEDRLLIKLRMKRVTYEAIEKEFRRLGYNRTAATLHERMVRLKRRMDLSQPAKAQQSAKPSVTNDNGEYRFGVKFHGGVPVRLPYLSCLKGWYDDAR